MRRGRLILLAILAAMLSVYWYLLLDDRVEGSAVTSAPRIETLRQVATSLPGPAPESITAYVTGINHIAGNMLVAGSGLQSPRLAATGYAALYPDRAPVVIDTGLSESVAASTDVEAFSQSRRDELDRRITDAQAILLTSTAPPFASGLLANSGIADAGPRLHLGEMQAERLGDATLLPDDGPVAIAPGIVSIPAPGYEPGSRMIFVRLSNGRELLFTGPNALIQRSWLTQKPPARLTTDHWVKMSRASVRAWLSAIADLQEQAPDMTIVTGHDIDVLLQQFNEADGALGSVRFGMDRPGVFAEPREVQ